MNSSLLGATCSSSTAAGVSAELLATGPVMRKRVSAGLLVPGGGLMLPGVISVASCCATLVLNGVDAQLSSGASFFFRRVKGCDKFGIVEDKIQITSTATLS